MVPPMTSLTASERLWRRVDTTVDDCWLWPGAKTSSGYGSISVGNRRTGLVHRVAYEDCVGPIPEGFHVDHLCRSKLCVRPSHLEAVTQAENNRRMVAVRTPKLKTECKYGHPFTGDNLAFHKEGWKICRTCQRERGWAGLTDDVKRQRAAASKRWREENPERWASMPSRLPAARR